MGFFDFIADLPHYEDHTSPVPRMNKRYEALIDPFVDEISGAKVLDLASHDGRWCYAFAGAGARSVVGIEGRQEMVDKFGDYPDANLRAKVEMRVGDLYEGMEDAVKNGETYDVIGVFGILYHVMDHFRLFQLARKLQPKLILVDSEFMLRSGPIMLLKTERTSNVLNAIPQFEGQERAIKAVPSFVAMEHIADALGYKTEWVDWDARAKDDRRGVSDYYREKEMRRGTCALRPIA
ncbi:Methyltransferase domain-containing protein [Octadecabacter temperatus]|uniref:tRNA (Mo5U34)-methyltransferase n=1 Tax=Octadecabacter temperatus TaxID=1458307 RepID=A0A0K0Y446_9RHOB|nr:class I SAM-dependent methyltransferase [Octadecabacter temperatus]AKS45733.1 tRNA (mo5U34)-methyltransferase [Octadecabacter temperatus]SIN99328.1 Methyltransferase domain-containing protein [Octadecabacter temperatus]